MSTSRRFSSSTLFGVCVVLGVCIILVLIAVYLLTGLPGEPKLTVLGRRVTPTWQPILAETLDRPQWDNEVVTWIEGVFTDEQHNQFKKRENRWIDQDLINLQVPDRLGRTGGKINAGLSAIASLSEPGQRYSIRLINLGNKGHQYRFALQYSWSKEQLVLTVEIGWAFPQPTGMWCRLRYQLTPTGFELIEQIE